MFLRSLQMEAVSSPRRTAICHKAIPTCGCGTRRMGAAWLYSRGIREILTAQASVQTEPPSLRPQRTTPLGYGIPQTGRSLRFSATKTWALHALCLAQTVGESRPRTGHAEVLELEE